MEAQVEGHFSSWAAEERDERGVLRLAALLRLEEGMWSKRSTYLPVVNALVGFGRCGPGGRAVNPGEAGVRCRT